MIISAATKLIMGIDWTIIISMSMEYFIKTTFFFRIQAVFIRLLAEYPSEYKL